MKSFENRQRIRVTAVSHELCGLYGTVVRLRIKDDQAWVNMDAPLRDGMRYFPEGDSAGRENHTLLAPDECEPASVSGGHKHE
jgi:hypothetical protein